MKAILKRIDMAFVMSPETPLSPTDDMTGPPNIPKIFKSGPDNLPTSLSKLLLIDPGASPSFLGIHF